MKTITYSISVTIECPVERAAALFVDRAHMARWELGLLAIEDGVGRLFEDGSRGRLVFAVPNGKMLMDVAVIKQALPEEITLEYRVSGVVNRCHNTFVYSEKGTVWTMESRFDFAEEIDISRDRFIAKTTASMNLFKQFAEEDHSKSNSL